jgi:3-oxoacyl-(acyl-carrier-protein) synthase
MTARIVVTGMGAVSPYGVGVELLWNKLMAGETGLHALTSFDVSHVHHRAGGQLEDFRPEKYLSARLVRRIDRFTAFGLIAAQQALTDAGLSSKALEQPLASDVPSYRKQAAGRDRVGITVGNNLGGWEFAERELAHLWKDGPRAVSPYMATAWFPAAVQGIVSIQLGIKGIGRTFLGERASGAYAIKHAAHCLRQGYADKMFAGGAEAPFSPYAALCYETSGLMSSSQAIENPTCAYRPFDREHDGLVAGEGAAFLFLERAEDAVQRGAKIYAEIAGWATTNDGYDRVQPAPDGVRYAEAMRLALERAEVSPEQVDCVFAAGSAIPAEDLSETQAIRLALGQQANSVPVTAPKSAFGNLFGAATPLDVVIAVLTLQHRIIPPTLHLDNPAPGCDLEYVARRYLPVSRLDVIAVNARGIGGSNACLVLRRWSQDQ